jgi:hypothetical protein
MHVASDLKPGDVYAASDGAPHTIATVNHLSHQTTVYHADGTVRALFPNARVQIEGRP